MAHVVVTSVPAPDALFAEGSQVVLRIAEDSALRFSTVEGPSVLRPAVLLRVCTHAEPLGFVIMQGGRSLRILYREMPHDLLMSIVLQLQLRVPRSIRVQPGSQCADECRGPLTLLSVALAPREADQLRIKLALAGPADPDVVFFDDTVMHCAHAPMGVLVSPTHDTTQVLYEWMDGYELNAVAERLSRKVSGAIDMIDALYARDPMSNLIVWRDTRRSVMLSA